jgi:hypothetical protein
MSLQVHLVFKGHPTELATEPMPFLNMLQVLPLEMFAEIPRGMKLIYALSYRQVLA